MLFRGKVGNESDGRLLEGRHHAPERLGHVLVLGLGVSGKAAVSYLAPLLGQRVASLVVLAGKSTQDALDWVDAFVCDMGLKLASSVDFVFDEEDAAACIPAGRESFDLCIASPGISVFSDLYESASAASARIVSEVELAWGESPADSLWVAVTGTNGKTTTTALAAHILADAGFRARAVGNIGDACIEAVASDLIAASDATGAESSVSAGDAGCDSSSKLCYVAELSSFQLASIDAFAPDVAVMLGIKPDHVEWHGTYDHYVASKMRLLDNLRSAQGGVAVLDATNDEVRSRIRQIKGITYAQRGYTYIPLGTASGIGCDMRDACGSDNAAFVGADGALTVAFGGEQRILCNADELGIKGPHNWTDALAAASAAIALGTDARSVAGSLRSFKALPHRIEPVGTVGDVAFYNDSKATNVDSTVRALSSFPGKRVAVMLGGHDKMTSLDELVCACRDNARVVVCYGEARERFMEALSLLEEDGVSVVCAAGLEDALDAALEAASAVGGVDVVLLSPACSSFDEFSCFEERGDAFRALVGALCERCAGSVGVEGADRAASAVCAR